jgi:hypothetical protein
MLKWKHSVLLFEAMVCQCTCTLSVSYASQIICGLWHGVMHPS